ncbi:uncharacterized protein LOC142575793 isoform X2 [Dermacentor variabilis]|uniref:uncharacterized protein LOC142575793 isoform X2 n=1 Tax=Dermacentor variabilis TaxID=34621 RepID=UPI003F5CA659
MGGILLRGSFDFPDNRYAVWLDYSNRMDLAELPKEQVRRSQYLCSDHFTGSGQAAIGI